MHFDHVIDIDSEPHHSELHEGNKEMIRDQLETIDQYNRDSKRRKSVRKKGMVETSSSFYQNYSPSVRKSVRTPSDDIREDIPAY